MNLFIALLAVAACASAQKEEDPSKFKHPLTDMPRSAEDVETSPYFPQHPDHKLPVGETITTLCHFSNEGSSYYNVTAVMGSLNSPFEFRHHFQNYSYKTFGTLVKAGEEMSFKYTFQLHPDLEPVDYQLAVTVFYESDKQSFSTTFFNQTVELYHPTSEYDLQTISAVLYGILLSVLCVLVTVFACCPDTHIPVVSAFFNKVSQLEKQNIRSLASKVDPDDDWLSDQPATKATAAKGKKE